MERSVPVGRVGTCDHRRARIADYFAVAAGSPGSKRHAGLNGLELRIPGQDRLYVQALFTRPGAIDCQQLAERLSGITRAIPLGGLDSGDGVGIRDQLAVDQVSYEPFGVHHRRNRGVNRIGPHHELSGYEPHDQLRHGITVRRQLSAERRLGAAPGGEPITGRASVLGGLLVLVAVLVEVESDPGSGRVGHQVGADVEPDQRMLATESLVDLPVPPRLADVTVLRA